MEEVPRAVLMLIPIVMVVVSVTLTGQWLRWISVIAAVGLFVFNIIGLPTYPGLYDKFLIVVGPAFNAATAWYAWTSYPWAAVGTIELEDRARLQTWAP